MWVGKSWFGRVQIKKNIVIQWERQGGEPNIMNLTFRAFASISECRFTQKFSFWWNNHQLLADSKLYQPWKCLMKSNTHYYQLSSQLITITVKRTKINQPRIVIHITTSSNFTTYSFFKVRFGGKHAILDVLTTEDNTIHSSRKGSWIDLWVKTRHGNAITSQRDPLFQS